MKTTFATMLRLPGGFALAASLVLAAAFLLAPDRARAADECGALNSGNSFTETCADQAYASGIAYTTEANAVTLTVGGGTATTITSVTTGASWNNGIIIEIANSTSKRDVSLTVGNAGAVAILQGASAQANAWYRNHGIQVVQRSGGGSTVTMDVRSGVTIGTSTTRMANSGISLVLDNAAATGAGAMSVTSGAAIYAATHGINFANPGPGASTVTNSGAIDASNQGIRVDDSGSAGAVTITSSGAITSGWQGIYAHTRGTGKDAAGTNAGISVTHSAGAITSSNNRGIHVLVGASRQESNTGHADYVAPINTGTAKIAVTGGSISASLLAIEAINYEAGGIDIDVSSGVTVTSSTGSGIYAGVHDVGNTSGGIDVDNAGEITAAVTGIWVRQSGTANTVSVTVDNEGALKKTGANTGFGIRVQQNGDGGVTVTNSGAIGEASATNQHRHGIYVRNEGAGATTVTNSGAIHASQRGISVEDTGSDGAMTITSSGAITTSDAPGIFAETRGKDAAGTNAGVSVTHSGGAITTSNAQGIQARVGAFRSESNAGGAGYVAPENTGTVKIAVTGGSIRAGDLDAIEAINYEAGGIDIDVSSGVMVTSWAASGIYAGLTDVGNTAGAIDVDNAGDVTAAVTGIWIWQNVTANTVSVSVTNEGAIEKTGVDTGYGIRVDQSGVGDVTVMNSGAIGDATTRHEHGIHVSHSGTGAGAVSVTNSGAVMATEEGILVEKAGTSGDVSVTTTGGSITSATGHGIHVQDNADHTGSVTVANAGDITAEKSGIVVNRLVLGSGAVSVTSSGGTVRGRTEPGIVARNKMGDASDVTVTVSGGTVRSVVHAVNTSQHGTGSLTVSVSEGATLISKSNAGLFASLGNGDQVEVTQRGAILGRTGVLVQVAASATAETVTPRDAMDQPVIDVDWSGSFAAGTTAQTAPDDNDRFVATTAAVAVLSAREVVTEQTIRYGSPAGIEAQVMSWRDVMTEVAKGDDPDPFADLAAQQAAVPTGATADDNAYVEQFRAALGNDQIDVSAVLTAIDSSATSLDDITDAEIVTYLHTDDAATRTLLRNILAESFTDEEKAVLRAVVTNTGLDAALDDADAGFDADYKAAVRALLARYNVGNIDVDMTGGSIDSRGDGIRAYYATPNANNGAISVTIAAGATVTGANAGIYVANAGLDMGADADSAADDILKQSVVVNGMVTGGTDAAVHLVGGGMLTVGEMGRVVAGDGQPAILVNDPGRAVIVIDGSVQGSEGADAAVHLTGGGSVTVGLTGRVTGLAGKAILVDNANRAADAARTSSVTVHAAGLMYREDADEADSRVLGGIDGDDLPRNAGDRIMITLVAPGGEELGRTLLANGRMDNADLPMRPQPCPDGQAREADGKCPTPTPCPTGQMRGDDGQCRATTPTPPPCPTGQMRGDDGQCRATTPTPTPCPTGQTRGEDGQCRATQPPPTRATGFDCTMPKANCHLYEALPSVLLAMNGLPSYAERMSAVRDASGGWARVEAARGKWTADRSTQLDLAYDHSRTGLRAGVDMAMGEGGRIGVTAHGLTGQAKMAQGKIELTGMGVGIGAAATGDGFYFDAQAAATWYDVDLSSAAGGKLKDGVKGTGHALTLETGRPLAVGRLTLTPRAGLAWSRVSLKDFVPGTMELGTAVSVKKARSLEGRAGLRVEADSGGLRLFGSVDVTQEFSKETETRIVNTALKASTAATGVRVGLGGRHSWGDGRYAVSATARYTAARSSNNAFGGGLSMAVRF